VPAFAMPSELQSEVRTGRRELSNPLEKGIPAGRF